MSHWGRTTARSGAEQGGREMQSLQIVCMEAGYDDNIGGYSFAVDSSSWDVIDFVELVPGRHARVWLSGRIYGDDTKRNASDESNARS